MTVSRKEAERQNRKKLIVRGALKVFKNKGLEHATMDEIAHEAEFGKATLYYYFKSKEEIFNTILISGWEALWDGIEELVLTDDTPRRKFIKIIKKMIEMVNEDRPLYEFLFFAPHSFANTENTEADWKEYQIKMTNMLHQLIQTGMENNEFPQLNSQMTLKALGHIFHGMVLMGQDRDNITEEEVEELFRQFIENQN